MRKLLYITVFLVLAAILLGGEGHACLQLSQCLGCIYHGASVPPHAVTAEIELAEYGLHAPQVRTERPICKSIRPASLRAPPSTEAL